MENIDTLKHTIKGAPKYRLSNANVFVSECGYHFIDYLDPVELISPDIGKVKLTPDDIQYIEKSLQSNFARFDNQLNIVNSVISLNGKVALDIGCGGGLFLSKIRDYGAKVIGLELSDKRALYAKMKHNIEIIQRPIEDDYIQAKYPIHFDVVSLWDVIEHVNYPQSTLESASKVLKKNGYLFIDTPCRDSFYHKIGEFTYGISKGKYPTFLNAMYSSHRFGHKQIFSTKEICYLLDRAGIDIVRLKKFHELSFPYNYYLKKLFKSDYVVKLLFPLVKFALFVFPVKNKMLVIGRKR